MSADHILRLLHFLSNSLMVAGLFAVLLPLLRAWNTEDIDRQVMAFEEADTAKVTLLVPGAILTGISGFVWAIKQEYDLITTGWLLALIFVYLFVVAFCLPLVNLGLRRVQLLAMQAQKKGEGITPELREALGDNVPLVFGLIMLAAIPVMAWLPIFKPF